MSRYACSDLHGDLNLWKQIKSFLKENDELYFLGDVIDRGEDGIEILKDMMNLLNVYFIIGNHEEMMINSIEELDKINSDLNIENFFYSIQEMENFELWCSNGGYPTYVNFMSETEETQKEILNYLKNKTFKSITILSNKNQNKILLSHSGKHDTWDRWHFRHFEVMPVKNILIHGHTPYMVLRNDLPKEEKVNKEQLYPVWYNNNQKCDIDCGTVFTKEICLLDLDTFDIHMFKHKEN